MPLVFFILALVVFFFHWIFQKRKPEVFREMLLIYLLVFAVGFTAIASFIAHVFYPEFTARMIGWDTCQFQFEVGVANLALGSIAILSFWLRGSFLFAAILGNTVWLWGDAVGHIRSMLETGNFATGNAGIYFWADVLLPLFILLLYYRKEKAR